MRKGEQTRQEIVRQAAPIFNQRGFEGTSLSDLMQATGLEKGGIYRHFASKEKLAGEAFDYAWETAVGLRFEGTEEIPNTVDRLRQIIRNFRDRRTGLVAGGCPLLNTAMDSDDGNAHLRKKAQAAMQDWLGKLRAVIVSGQKKGEIRKQVDPQELATLIIGNLEGSLMISRLQGDRAPIEIACRQLELYLEEKVRAGNQRKARRTQKA